MKNSFGKRLIKNKAALAGIVIIITSIVIAFSAYLIVPDTTPNANRIIPEIGSKKPGFSIQFLLLKKEKNNEENFLQKIISGKQDAFTYIPITSYKQKNDSIIYQKYVDDNIFETKTIALKNIASPNIVTKNSI